MNKEEKIKEVAQKLDRLSTFMVKGSLKALPKILAEDEDPEDMIQGNYKDKNGLLVATNKRLLFVSKGIFWGMDLLDFSYHLITSIEVRTNLTGGGLTIYASGNAEEITNVTPKNRSREFSETVRRRMSLVSSGTSGNGSVVDQLEKLAALKEKGILSEEEFNNEKRKILQT